MRPKGERVYAKVCDIIHSALRGLSDQDYVDVLEAIVDQCTAEANAKKEELAIDEKGD